MATCLSWTKPSEQPLHFIWRAKRTLHSRLFSRATLMWSHDPSLPTPPLNSNGELARGCLRWIMKLNDHKNEFCHFLNTKRALSRRPTNGIWTESFWSTQDSLVEDIRNASGMPPYLKVSYTNLSPKAHVPTPRHGQYFTHAPNHIRPAVTAKDSCLLVALEKKKQKTNLVLQFKLITCA